MRSQSEARKLAWLNGKFKTNKIGYDNYRLLCEFRFSLNEYPEKFNFDLIKEYGWYSPTNSSKPNLDGVSRDHILSVKEGFEKDIDPYYISHPANCQLMTQRNNSSKNIKSEHTKEDLIKKIKTWDINYDK